MMRQAACRLLPRLGQAASAAAQEQGSLLLQQQGALTAAVDALQQAVGSSAEFSSLASRSPSLATSSSGCSCSSSTPSSSLGATPPHALQQRRQMGLRYARKLDRATNEYANRNDVVAFHGQLCDYLVKLVPGWVKFAVAGPGQSVDSYNEATLYTSPEHLLPLVRFLRDHVNTQFKCLIDITAVDFPERAARFEVVYHLLSPRWNNRIRIKVCVDEVTAVPSITPLYPAANWFERETWDMFGVFFSNHPDLRRILTDYGFQGHPLRKDFPLTGYTEVRYDYSKKRVVSEPLELTQEMRLWNLESPWDTLTR